MFIDWAKLTGIKNPKVIQDMHDFDELELGFREEEYKEELWNEFFEDLEKKDDEGPAF